jgi:N-acetylneuraminic acid mutarotase
VPRHLLSTLALTCAALLAACGEDTPTQPSRNAPDPALTAPSLAITSNSWTPIAPMPGQDGSGPAIGVVTNSAGLSKAFVFGGTNGAGGSGAATRIYNVATNTWSLPKDPFSNHVYVFNTNGVGNIGGKLYFSGGYDYGGGTAEIQSQVWAFDPATETLTRKADIPLHTADGVSGVISNRLYVLPGTCSGDGWPYAGYCEHEPVRKLFRYSPASNTWVTKATAPHYHKNGVGGVINDKFYVAGGQNDRLAPTAYLDVYDPATNTWKTLAPLPSALNGVVGAVLGSQLFVIGTTSGGSIRHYAYNPTSNKWNAKAAPSAYGGPAAKVVLNGASRLLVLSGATEDNPDHSQMYTP